MDRFLTRIPLLETLSEMGYLTTCTIMGNRVPKYVKSPLDKEANRRDVCQLTNGKIVADVNWKGTKAVIAAPTDCSKDTV